MSHKSYWGLNKEVMINQALVDYKDKDCPSAGFNILRYHGKGVLQVKPEYRAKMKDMFASFGPERENVLKYVILRLAKLGALEWNGV